MIPEVRISRASKCQTDRRQSELTINVNNGHGETLMDQYEADLDRIYVEREMILQKQTAKNDKSEQSRH